MPTFGSYSPWQDAANNTFGRVGNSLNELALQIARARYNRNNRAAMLGLQLERLQQQEMLNQAHEKSFNAASERSLAAAGLDQARTSHQQAVDDAATQFQAAVVANDYPSPLAEGPTLADQAQMLAARQHGAVAKVAGLHGTPQQAFPVHNIPANSVAIDPMSGVQIGQGAVELAPGGMYQSPSGQQVVNPRPWFAPAGSTPMDQQGQPTGPQTGFRPTAPGSRSSAVDAAWVRGLSSGEIAPGDALYNIAMRHATNDQGQAVSPQPMPQAAQRPPHTPEEEALLQDANQSIAKMVQNGWHPQDATNAVMTRLKQINPNFNPQ